MSNNENNGEILIYQSEDGKTRIEVYFENETVWLTQAQMAELFQTTKQNVSLHIKNIFLESELSQNSVVKESLTTARDGKKYKTTYYNLDVVISAGYRVKSHRGTQFRQWATSNLREYLVKGFVMDDARLKDPGGWDYFDELLERIREIRASEKRFYQKIKDIYALSANYQPNAESTQAFFKTVQNKMLWAVTRKTAAELLVERSNATLPNMGLTSWKGSRVRKGDIGIAKNYLNHEEISELDRIVTMFIDYAEDQTKKRKSIYMKDWEERIGAFLNFHERPVLNHAGNISHDTAEEIVHQRYEKFDLNRREQELLQSENEAIEEIETKFNET